MAMETRDEFETRYKEQNPSAIFGDTHVSMWCHCDAAPEAHWAAIRRTVDAICDHLDHEDALAELAASHIRGVR